MRGKFLWAVGAIVTAIALATLYGLLLPSHPGLTDAEATAKATPLLLTQAEYVCYANVDITVTVAPPPTGSEPSLSTLEHVAMTESAPLSGAYISDSRLVQMHNLQGLPVKGVSVWLFTVTPFGGITMTPALEHYDYHPGYRPICAIAIVRASDGKPLGLRIG